MGVKDVEFEREIADEERIERYPFIIRLYGALSIIGGGVQIVLFVLGVLAIVNGRIDFSAFEGTAATTAGWQ